MLKAGIPCYFKNVIARNLYSTHLARQDGYLNTCPVDDRAYITNESDHCFCRNRFTSPLALSRNVIVS